MNTLAKLLAAALPAIMIAGAPVYIASTSGHAIAAESTKATDSVKKGLRIFNQVVGHTGRLITAKSYDSVPHEHEEVVEGAEILREGLAANADMKAKAEPAIVKAVAASTTLSDLSKSKDDAKINAAHAAFADSVKDLIALFPEDLRPQPKK
jgi:hypothetical protein